MKSAGPQPIDPKLPGMSDEAVRAATGKGWAEWVELINAWPGSSEGHTAVAAWLTGNFPIDGWWAQGITVGWERLTGRRQPHQQADGTFSTSSSRTLQLDFESLRRKLLDDGQRDRILGLSGTRVISRPESKAVRLELDGAVILFDQYPNPDGRTRLTVTHERLKTAGDVEIWKAHWTAWLKSWPTS